MKQFDKILSNWFFSQVVGRNRQVRRKSFDQGQEAGHTTDLRQTHQLIRRIATEPDKIALTNFSDAISAFPN